MEKDNGAFQYYERLRRVREFVESNYDEEINLKAAAKVAALESSYFSAYFKRKVGTPFSYWLQEFRIARAVEILESEDCAITDLAHRVGFADLRTFERAFKKAKKMTPIDFKKKIRQA